MMLAAELPL